MTEDFRKIVLAFIQSSVTIPPAKGAAGMKFYEGLPAPRGFHARAQLAEAFGSTNRYFCSQKAGYSVRDRSKLLEHFARNCGARDFNRRFNEAMGDDNRWFCSLAHGRFIDNEKALWSYYKKHSKKEFQEQCGQRRSA